MDTSIEGHVALVTGGGSGIGLATTELFLAEGASVVVTDLDASSVSGLDGDRVLGLELDMTAPDSAQTAVDAALDGFGRLDALVNNVGAFPGREGFLQTTLQQWRDLIELNFLTAVSACQAAIPAMIRGGGGAIVSIGSDVGRQPDFHLVDYSITKQALLGLSKCLANEFGPHGIRSNVVSPGPIRTPQWYIPGGFGDQLAQEFGLDRDAAIDKLVRDVRKLPAGRIGEPEDVAAVVVFLCSPVARQVTGSEYPVNGGSYALA